MTLKQLYPELYEKYREQFEALRNTARSVEEGDLSEVRLVNIKRDQLLKKLIDENIEAGIFTCPDPLRDDSASWTQKGYSVEAKFYLSKIHRGSHSLDRLDLRALKFSGIRSQALSGDPFAKGILLAAAKTLEKRAQIYKLLDPARHEQLLQLKQETIFGLD